MSIIFATDLHLDNYKPFSQILQNGMNSRLVDQFEVVRAANKIMVDNSPEAIVYLGDLFNGLTESLPKIIYTAAYLAIRAWSQIAPLYLVIGNHDVYRGMHVMSTFESLPNVHIIARTTQVKIGDYVLDLIPWENPLPDPKGDICAGHIDVFGALMDADGKKKSETGMKPGLFQGYKYVLLGHFHNPQTFEVPGSLVSCYIGSMMQTDRRRSPNGHMGLVKLEDGAIVGLPIKSPRILDVTINTKDELEEFIRGQGNELHGAKDYFKVYIRSADFVYPSPLPNVSVEYDLPEITSSRLSETDADSKAGASQKWDQDRLQVATETYLRNSNTVLDKDLLVELAKELLK